ncbi:MAG: MraY family glycosyltransferase [Terriglobia bacterium]
MIGLLPFLSLGLSFILIPLSIRFCRWLGVHDHPGEDLLKVHRQPVPNLGGTGIFVASAVSWISYMYYQGGENNILKGILCGGLMVVGLGVWDDLRDLNPLVRVAGQSIAGLVAVSWGVSLNIFSHEWINFLMTIFYVLGAINSVNMLDGLDGLAGGAMSLSLVAFSITFALQSSTIHPVLPLIPLGALVGFLFFNFNPARVFMGNNGSAFLGFVIAIFGILASNGSYHVLGLIGPILIIGLPVLDTAVAIIRRLRKGAPVYLGDRSHIYDQLVDKGLTVRKTVLVCYAVQAILTSAGLWVQLSLAR